MRIELLGPLGTQTSHKGDKVFGRVAAPDAYKGDSVEGQVRDVHSGSKLRGGGAVLYFSFDTLTHAGQAVPITSQVKSFQNSQGQADVDEEGRVVRQGGGNQGKAVAGTLAGGLIGGLAGGWKGAAIGSAVGAASSIAVIEIAADSPNIRFGAGSIITIGATFHGNPPVGANTPATVAAATPAPAQTSSSALAASTAAPASAPVGGSAQPTFT